MDVIIRFVLGITTKNDHFIVDERGNVIAPRFRTSALKLHFDPF